MFYVKIPPKWFSFVGLSLVNLPLNLEHTFLSGQDLHDKYSYNSDKKGRFISSQNAILKY